MNYVLLGNTVIAYLVYFSVGFFGYLVYPDNIRAAAGSFLLMLSRDEYFCFLAESNILKNLQGLSTLFVDIVGVAYAIAIVFHYPVHPFSLSSLPPPSSHHIFPFRWFITLSATPLS